MRLFVLLLAQFVIRDMHDINDTSSKFGTFSFQSKMAECYDVKFLPVMGFWVWVWVRVIIPCSYSP